MCRSVIPAGLSEKEGTDSKEIFSVHDGLPLEASSGAPGPTAASSSDHLQLFFVVQPLLLAWPQ